MTSAEPGVAFPPGPFWPNFWERFTPAYVAEMAAFLDLVEGGLGGRAGAGASPCSVPEALEALYVAEAAEVSRREGRPVRVAEVRR